MCECGCTMDAYQWKLPAKDGSVFVFRVYPSCRNCCAPAGVDYARIEPDDRGGFDEAMKLPDLAVDPRYGIGGIAVLDIEIMRKRVYDTLLNVDVSKEGGIIDDAWADVLAEEAVPDLREAVWETRKIAEQGDTF